MYYTWNRKGKPTCYSLTKPTFPRLISEYDENMEKWDIEKNEIPSEEEKEQLILEIEEFRDEQQEKIDNMPWQLQEDHILTERVEELDALIDEINDIEING